jgi:hypothetical protein
MKMKPYELCMALAKCESSEDAKNVLINEGIWNDPTYWRYIDDLPNNASIIQNQQSRAINAFIEKPVNCGDSILTSKVREAGIDPEDILSAPSSMKEAKEKFLHIPNGDISRLDEKQRTKLARECGGVVSTGDTIKPTYAIWDYGEGQSPENFPTTFCGLANSNKTKIHFVQGKHCSGSSGALVYCEEGMQLIISRRSPKIKDTTCSDDIGFTITRRFPAGSDRQRSYKYLVINNEVPKFSPTPLTILPKDGSSKNYEKDWEYGTFIKMYNYDIGSDAKSLASWPNLDLIRKLSIHMVNPTFPLRFYERRASPSGGKGHSLENNVSGLLTKIEIDRAGHVEPNTPFSFSFTVDSQIFTGSIFVLKSNVTGSKLRKWHGDDGVLFTLNGQVNAVRSKAIYANRGIGLDYIKDKIITVIDCSNLDNDHLAELFKNDRERLATSAFTNAVIAELSQVLGSQPGLKSIQDRHRSERIQNQCSDNKPVENMVQALLKTNRVMNATLLSGPRLSNPFGSNQGKGSWAESFFPTYFQLDKKNKNFSKKKPRKVELTRKANFTFDTDAPNDYLSRFKDTGSYEVFVDGSKILNKISLNGSEGVWHLNFEINQTYAVGQIIEIKLSIDDVSRPYPIEEKFWLEVVPFQKRLGGSKIGIKKNAQKGSGNNSSASKSQLPPIIEVQKGDDNWKNFGWSDKDAFNLIRHQAQYDIYINMDNIYLHTEQKYSKNPSDKTLTQTCFKSGLVIQAMALAFQDNKEQFKDFDEHVRAQSLTMAPIIIPLTKDLAKSISI